MPPRSGPLPPELARAFEQGLLAGPAAPPRTPGTSAVRSDWLIPIIRVAFTDSAIVYPAAALEQRLFDASGANPTGSMTEYYTWVSGHRITVRGQVVATVTLPHDRNYYAADASGVNALGTPNNDYGLFHDAVKACDGQVDFSRFDLDNDGYVDMLWIVHAGPGAETSGSRRDFWSLTSRATQGWNNGFPFECDDLVPGSLTQHMRIDRFTILPELSGYNPGQPAEIGVFCHEFGHTLGLPDLYDTSVLGGAANVGPGEWSLMSTGAYGGDGISPESPSGMGAWCLLWLGWANRIRPAQDTTLVLPTVADGGPVVEFWFQGEDSPEHFLIENRQRESFDRKLPADGLLIQQVDEGVVGPRVSGNRINTGPTPGLRVLEADGQFDMYSGYDRGDAGDPFPGRANRTHIDDLSAPSTRTFLGAPTNISLESIAPSGRTMSVRMHVRAPGWGEPQDVAPGGAAPERQFGAATRTVVAPNGDAWQVTGEAAGGRHQIVLRARTWPGAWQSGTVVVDGSQGAATEPTVARVGPSDLALAWLQEDAGGITQVAYRARIRGVWTAPRQLTQSAGGCLAPAIAADGRGRVFLAWLESLDGIPRLRFLEFLYGAPYGQPITVTMPIAQPAPPTVTAAGNGHAFLLWPDHGTGNHVVNACRFQPDSGLSAPFILTPATNAAQPAVSAVVDTAGNLYCVWQVSPGTGSEIHFQRRPAVGRPAPRDTTIDAIGDALQNPRIALDATGGLHVAYERLQLGVQRIRYKLWRPGLGWDERATEVSDAADLSTAFVEVLPTSTGNVTVLWSGFDGSGQRLRMRERKLDGNLVTAVPPQPPRAEPELAAGPNPLRAGQALELAGAALHPGDTVDLVDAAGRKVASALADAAGRAHILDTGALLPGLYFASVRSGAARGRIVVLR